MTADQKLAALEALAKRYTALHTTSPEVAMKELVREGFYNRDGTLSENYGGLPKKKSNRARAKA